MRADSKHTYDHVKFRLDDLSGETTQALITRHLAGMHEHTPPESVHALDLSRLRHPDVSLWSAWVDGALAGCGALKRLDDERGELKSMRVDDAFLGRGIGRAILEHLLAQARAKGNTSVWLETGAPEAFLPARRLYESVGFVECRPFAGYTDDRNSVFMTLAL